MQTTNLVMERAEARALYRKYREHQHWSEPLDREIQRVYQLLAQGRVVIKALESIAAAGLGEDHRPRLAIIRADAGRCFVAQSGRQVRFSSKWWARDSARKSYVDLPPGAFGDRRVASGEAIVPLVPLHLRPKRGLANYHILFEAVWKPVPPSDPLLLRRIGVSDLWVVLAAWDLTEIEKAVLAGRINA